MYWELIPSALECTVGNNVRQAKYIRLIH